MRLRRSALAAAADDQLTVHQLIERVDADSVAAHIDRAATCLLVEFDPVRGVRSYASAGHLPPAVLYPDRTIEVLPLAPGPPLGTGLGGYATFRCPVHPGAVVLLYTDGLVERRGQDIEQCVQRLEHLRLRPDLPLPGVIRSVLTQLSTHASEDDVAVLAARLHPRCT
ncbi:serine/threonine-protein phosphatase [Streptomyces sp. TRM66268-LWL]|uniref:Serine/threonine-protein phosphatase n=1 Tax=Streptomyces polyasparticus TaxID=2767826 RepID=A0ABR7SEC0_9ACTN|nr:PP2C family protein-serine/threonine phosphatase [Streptomyces polyasparticus]MBC9713524.1 serine/threonine-protein phosphatase [Streptomyces polyasparticus]